MTRRFTFAAIVVLISVTATIFFAHGAAILLPASDLQRNPLPFSPADQQWSWSFRLPDNITAEDRLSLRIRSTSSALPAGVSPIISLSPAAMPATNAQREAATACINFTSAVPQPKWGNAALQLLDLSKMGVASTKAGANLRVLATLQYGSATVNLSGDDIFLPAGQFAGYSQPGEGTWVNNELYLMKFYVRGDATVWQYDVFLAHGAPPSPR